MSRVLRMAVAAYALLLTAALVLLYPLGDRFWLSTLLLVGPRFVLGLPLPLLAFPCGQPRAPRTSGF